jgi:hypothetical protein
LFGGMVLDLDVDPIDITELAQSLLEGLDSFREGRTRPSLRPS